MSYHSDCDFIVIFTQYKLNFKTIYKLVQKTSPVFMMFSWFNALTLIAFGEGGVDFTTFEAQVTQHSLSYSVSLVNEKQLLTATKPTVQISVACICYCKSVNWNVYVWN